MTWPDADMAVNDVGRRDTTAAVRLRSIVYSWVDIRLPDEPVSIRASLHKPLKSNVTWQRSSLGTVGAPLGLLVEG